MKRKVELPLLEPLYSTYHNQGPCTAIIINNPSIRNWYLNEVMILSCNRKFLSGYTSPELDIVDSSWLSCPYINQMWISFDILGGYTNAVIRNLINEGNYVHFNGVDDYYMKGKSWYKERHVCHDGTICGYNQEDKTFCIYAYDEDWVYRKFWTPQECFSKGRKTPISNPEERFLCALKAKDNQIEFLEDTALKNINEYLVPTYENYGPDIHTKFFGIEVQDYIVKYLEKLIDGSIPYEKIDNRVFRLIWEHKKGMIERIRLIEKALNIGTEISTKYSTIVKEADNARMLYASYCMKRRDAILPILQKKLNMIKEKEFLLLNELLKKR